ncbi:MAG: FecR domain-containing protein [Phycisphaeraceae bacterium]
MSDATALLHRHLNGETLTEQESAELSAWVCASPDNAKLVAELSSLDQSIVADLRHQASAPLMDTQDEGADLIDDTLTRDAYAPEIMQELVAQAQTKRSKDQQFVFDTAGDMKVQPVRQFTASDAKWITGKLFNQAIRSKAVAASAIAAVLLLGMVLLITLMSEPNAIDQIAEQPIQPPTQQAPAVAMLTATYNAQWAEQPNEGLRAGDRLTLTQGFAEITTLSGAIAILEAPASVELLDHDNAIRLHAGKIVAVCKTPASQGFVVKTRHADIVDLGTEFGVIAVGNELTTTVFNGKVEVTTPGTETQPLNANQTARLDINGNQRSFLVEEGIATGFQALRAQSLADTQWPLTGVDLEPGEIDPNWHLVAIDAKPLDTPLPMKMEAAYTELRIPDTQANWIAMDTAQYPFGQQVGRIAYTFKTTLLISYQTDPNAIQLALRYLVDDEIEAIRINGQPISIERPIRIAQRKIASDTISGPFVVGTNTIEFDVINHQANKPTDLVGLMVDWQLIDQTEPNP